MLIYLSKNAVQFSLFYLNRELDTYTDYIKHYFGSVQDDVFDWRLLFKRYTKENDDRVIFNSGALYNCKNRGKRKKVQRGNFYN